MSNTEQEKTEQNTPHFAIEKIYLKDVSFEVPSAPTVFKDDWAPEITMDLNSQGTPVEGNIFEVVLTITVTAKNNNKTGFLVEIKQAGIFSIANFSQDDMNGMLASFCPNILFPYAREAISDLVTKGGFPQLLLAPVNFDALYAQRLQEQANNSTKQ